jgi:hypothetical protein
MSSRSASTLRENPGMDVRLLEGKALKESTGIQNKI